MWRLKLLTAIRNRQVARLQLAVVIEKVWDLLLLAAIER